MMSRNVIIGFTAISIFASILVQYLSNDLSVGTVIGGAVAFLIGPYALTLFVRFFIKTIRSTPDEKSFLTTYSIFWLGFFILNILGKAQV